MFKLLTVKNTSNSEYNHSVKVTSISLWTILHSCLQ